MKTASKNSATLRNEPFNKIKKERKTLPKDIKGKSSRRGFSLPDNTFLDYEYLESTDLDYIAQLSLTLDREAFYEL